MESIPTPAPSFKIVSSSLDDSFLAMQSSTESLPVQPAPPSDAAETSPFESIGVSVMSPALPVSYPSIGISVMSSPPTSTAPPENECLAIYYNHEGSATASSGSFPSEVATSTLTISNQPTDSLRESTRPSETSEPTSSAWPSSDATSSHATSSSASSKESKPSPQPSVLETQSSSILTEIGPQPEKSEPIVYQGRQGVAQMAKLSTTQWFRDVLLSRFVSPAHRLLIVRIKLQLEFRVTNKILDTIFRNPDYCGIFTTGR